MEQTVADIRRLHNYYQKSSLIQLLNESEKTVVNLQQRLAELEGTESGIGEPAQHTSRIQHLEEELRQKDEKIHLLESHAFQGETNQGQEQIRSLEEKLIEKERELATSSEDFEKLDQ